MEDKMKLYPQTKRFLVVFLICFTAYQKMDVLNVMAETITFKPSNQSLYQLFPDHDIRKYSNLIRSIQIDGSIDNPGEKDRYSFYGKAGDSINLYLSKASGTYMSALIMNPDKTSLAYKKDNSNIELGYQTLPESGNYTITIDASGMITGTYSLYILKQTLQAISFKENGSVLIQGEITFPGEQDIYSFNGSSEEEISLFLNNGALMYRSVTIIKPDENIFLKSNVTPSDISLSGTLVQSGMYKIIIDGSGYRTGDYSFFSLQVKQTMQFPYISLPG
ncbi:MAG: hypothetical protein OMM_05288 [Candidatus Magnetoglobus multicellularis str. Araruama]|uniref:Peptidase C-terminal archaeal/bacterial domain-containing protein n=1 Tax=Candidatus Magnetoglobus multicellularis str. Araruama TaxID=890399 RepID=A0A1V1NX24_9BACT|nr:MAG: hypothetical protein OMM_05288 [Candidatus Magnetoglobus multicellularis str. Araruama]